MNMNKNNIDINVQHSRARVWLYGCQLLHKMNHHSHCYDYVLYSLMPNVSLHSRLWAPILRLFFLFRFLNNFLLNRVRLTFIFDSPFCAFLHQLDDCNCFTWVQFRCLPLGNVLMCSRKTHSLNYTKMIFIHFDRVDRSRMPSIWTVHIARTIRYSRPSSNRIVHLWQIRKSLNLHSRKSRCKIWYQNRHHIRFSCKTTLAEWTSGIT